MADTFPGPEPSFGPSSNSVSARVLKSTFGDGYGQRAADGINNVANSWALGWENITPAEMNQIDSFLRAKAGYESFYWTPRGESTPRLWTCEKWGKTPGTATVNSMTAVFSEVFDLV